jgi:mannose/fructose-specific phosphotransferase system component IIA
MTRSEPETRPAIAAHPDEDIIIFVDMAGSSCSRCGDRACTDRPGVDTITGVNLPMLIRFLAYRRRTPLPALVELMLRTGCESIGSG